MNLTNLILFYHKIPHVYKNFTKLNKKHYNLNNKVYVESLGIIGTLPAVVLIVILINLLIYLLSFSCCFKDKLSRVNYIVNKIVLLVVCVCCCTTIGWSLYYNDELNTSVGKLTNFVRVYESNVNLLGNGTIEAQNVINNNIQLNLNNIERNYHEQQENTSDSQSILKFIHNINYNLTTNYDLISDINSNVIATNYAGLLTRIENYRWLLLLLFYVSFIIINLLLIYGLAKRSRWSFITFSVLGLVVLIANWCVVSGWLVLAVATADTCIESKTNNTLLHSFINVNEINRSIGQIQQGLNDVRDTTKELRSLINFNYNFNYIEINIINLFEYYSTVELIINNISTYVATIATNYNLFKHFLCSQTLNIIHYLFLLNVLGSILLSILIYVDSYVWIYLIQSERRPPMDPSAPSKEEKYGGDFDEPATLRCQQGRNSRGTCGRPAASTLDHRHSLLHSTFPRPQNGKYKTLNSNCKLLDSSDYY